MQLSGARSLIMPSCSERPVEADSVHSGWAWISPHATRQALTGKPSRGNDPDLSYFSEPTRLANWLCSLGSSYEAYRDAFVQENVRLADLLTPQGCPDLLRRYLGNVKHQKAIFNAIECLKDLLRQNPLTWSSKQSCDFLFTLGSALWVDVDRLSARGACVSQIYAQRRSDTDSVLREAVCDVEHRRWILDAVEWACSPLRWTSDHLAQWLDALDSVGLRVLTDFVRARPELDGAWLIGADQAEILLAAGGDVVAVDRLAGHLRMLDICTGWTFSMQDEEQKTVNGTSLNQFRQNGISNCQTEEQRKSKSERQSTAHDGLHKLQCARPLSDKHKSVSKLTSSARRLSVELKPRKLTPSSRHSSPVIRGRARSPRRSSPLIGRSLRTESAGGLQTQATLSASAAPSPRMRLPSVEESPCVDQHSVLEPHHLEPHHLEQHRLEPHRLDQPAGLEPLTVFPVRYPHQSARFLKMSVTPREGQSPATTPVSELTRAKSCEPELLPGAPSVQTGGRRRSLLSEARPSATGSISRGLLECFRSSSISESDRVHLDGGSDSSEGDGWPSSPERRMNSLLFEENPRFGQFQSAHLPTARFPKRHNVVDPALARAAHCPNPHARLSESAVNCVPPQMTQTVPEHFAHRSVSDCSGLVLPPPPSRMSDPMARLLPTRAPLRSVSVSALAGIPGDLARIQGDPMGAMGPGYHQAAARRLVRAAPNEYERAAMEAEMGALYRRTARCVSLRQLYMTIKQSLFAVEMRLRYQGAAAGVQECRPTI
eukprot:1163821_1